MRRKEAAHLYSPNQRIFNCQDCETKLRTIEKLSGTGRKESKWTHCPLEEWINRVMSVEVPGHTQFRASMAYLNSSSHTTWSADRGNKRGTVTQATQTPTLGFIKHFNLNTWMLQWHKMWCSDSPGLVQCVETIDGFSSLINLFKVSFFHVCAIQMLWKY